ncbi:HAD-IA family hydrolase [Novosphingobium sp. Gsoil 351]|uniref:HAD-IA family hydrolase n=1 Tax=Novosphingobium sp. Gsoil 351 TaxID=2675225 RepID=UPI0012B48CB6|nr:HAD-IA family hydrolase [Novosphingobium sp. Gsoil 351]QGN54573.1 HAD-IA family hydrolase [Novosphingobium sp. Gsoil 351]
MAASRFDVVAFDLDGTLADTADDLAAALNYALVLADRAPLGLETVRAMVGHGTRALMRKGLAATGDVTEALVDASLPDLTNFYAANICTATTGYPGVEQALDMLAEQGSRLAVCTNKPERLATMLVEALGWTDRFAAVIGGDTLAFTKPDPAMLHAAISRAGGGRAAYVGDSITDADTARAAAIPFVAVSFGFLDRPVGELGAAAVIDHYDELPAALASLVRVT